MWTRVTKRPFPTGNACRSCSLGPASARVARARSSSSAGRVTVDGEVARLGRRADPKRQRIELDGVSVVVNDDLVYYLLNKPLGVVATASDPQGRTTVLDLVPSEPRVFSVGRLDNDTAGLIVLTNDGELTQLLTHPSHGVVKTYLAEVEGVPAPGALAALRDGVELDDGMTASAACASRAEARRERGGRARHPRGSQPPGSADVRRGRSPGDPTRAHAHRAGFRPAARAGRVACAAPG